MASDRCEFARSHKLKLATDAVNCARVRFALYLDERTEASRRSACVWAWPSLRCETHSAHCELALSLSLSSLCIALHIGLCASASQKRDRKLRSFIGRVNNSKNNTLCLLARSLDRITINLRASLGARKSVGRVGGPEHNRKPVWNISLTCKSQRT